LTAGGLDFSANTVAAAASTIAATTHAHQPCGWVGHAAEGAGAPGTVEVVACPGAIVAGVAAFSALIAK